MKHVVIGKGNLGLDLKLAVEARGWSCHVFTPSDGFSWPKCSEEIKALQPDYVWITAGAGSVEQCRDNPGRAFDTHLSLPIDVIEAMPNECKVGLFSTDYVADENDMLNPNKTTPKPKSIYALSKIAMETCVKIMARPNVSVFRVSSLYGVHFPDKTFPGKLLKNFPKPATVSLPQNFICPTATEWIAESIIGSLPILFSSVCPMFYNCASTGGTTVMNFGKKVLGSDYTLQSKGIDWNRPAYSAIGCSFMNSPGWEAMWERSSLRASLSQRNLFDAVSDSP